jgi:hypothetical protein
LQESQDHKGFRGASEGRGQPASARPNLSERRLDHHRRKSVACDFVEEESARAAKGTDHPSDVAIVKYLIPVLRCFLTPASTMARARSSALITRSLAA